MRGREVGFQTKGGAEKVYSPEVERSICNDPASIPNCIDPVYPGAGVSDYQGTETL